MMWRSFPDENIYQTCGAIAKKYNAFGILSDDTSFLCMQNMPDNLQIYSTDSLNLETLQTMKYDSRALARYFGIQVKDLPLLATLKGNDIIHRKSLKNFHQTQLGNYINTSNYLSIPMFMIVHCTTMFSLFYQGFVFPAPFTGPMDHLDLFRKIANFISTSDLNNKDIKELTLIVYGNIDLEQNSSKLKHSIDSYYFEKNFLLRSSESVDISIERIDDNYWRELMKMQVCVLLNCESISS